MASGAHTAAALLLIIALGMITSSWAAISAFGRPEATLDFTSRNDDSVNRWSLGGSSEVVGSKVVRLTSDQQSQRGWMFSKQPLKLIGREWQFDIEFRVHGKGMSYYGDGFAMWYTQDRYHAGDAFGHSARFVGLGVFFDTFDNAEGTHAHKHPWVSALVGTHAKPAVFHHSSEGMQRNGCHSRLREFGRSTRIGAARIRYKDRTLVVKLVFSKQVGQAQDKFEYEWTECVRMTDVDIPPGYYLGFTASTGDLSDNHDIYSVNVRGATDATVQDVPPEVSALWTEDPQSRFAQAGANRAPPAPAKPVRPSFTRTNRDRAAATKPAAEATPPAEPTPPAPPTPEPEPPRRLEDKPPTKEEMEEINNVLRSTPMVAKLRAIADENNNRVKRLFKQLEDELTRMNQQMEETLQSLQQSEVAIDKRLAQVEQRLQNQLEDVAADYSKSSYSWVGPFGLLLLGVLGCAGFGYRKYTQFRKTHML